MFSPKESFPKGPMDSLGGCLVQRTPSERYGPLSSFLIIRKAVFRSTRVKIAPLSQRDAFGMVFSYDRVNFPVAESLFVINNLGSLADRYSVFYPKDSFGMGICLVNVRLRCFKRCLNCL